MTDRDRETKDKQTYREADIQAERQIYRKKNRQTDRDRLWKNRKCKRKNTVSRMKERNEFSDPYFKML